MGLKKVEMRREQRFVFGEVADLYDRARPGYPEAMVAEVLERCSRPAPRMLEVGAGTGKATVAFAARGLEIVALEPTAEMASVAARNLGPFPSVTVEVATFEEWSGAPTRFDLVLAAQSWHLLRPGVRCERAHRALNAGGMLALCWNLPVWEEGGLRSEVDGLYERHAPALRASQAFPGLQAPAGIGWMTDELRASGLFGEATLRTYRWSRYYTIEQFLDLMNTHSDHRMLAERDRWALLGGAAGILERRGGGCQMSYETQLCLARALP